MPTNVLIAGGGPAALEAALSLHRLAGERVVTTLLAPDREFNYRPLSVLEPFAAGGAIDYPIARFATDAGFEHRLGTLASVDTAAHTVRTADGERIAYDVLLVAAGAVPVAPARGQTAFDGSLNAAKALHGLVQDIEGGYTQRVTFVVPPGGAWPLPLYELALMLAERAFEMGVNPELHFVTLEDSPLALFGPEASREVAELLATAGIVMHTSSRTERLEHGHLHLAPGGEELAVQRVVTLPRLKGPAISGLPADGDGFLVTDRYSQVTGAPDVYAAGDVTAFPVKQGGLACQQADAAAEHIAARAGADLEPVPFSPVLRGMLLTERWARFLRRDVAADESAVAGRALWWPPAKIAGRELAGYLQSLDEDFGHVQGIPVESRVVADTHPVEVLSLH
ncbi:FAD-dependent oxidoreductase [Solirubrobacter ginsenosidimutans]|uniref:FAD-dependent oxidoreductase n=1 Tax=Solirubrobacter ginsenosidimutans TaxID=490573 RepID=A0A9X3MVD5_9ACTN|nr:FAD-dependent oxidoreductase [Solirubrobacter ginsenosidimutans]MDA0163240.1 FAD-dependent oxidoreductase [Solirubrobacter ginsenosidimutans]